MFLDNSEQIVAVLDAASELDAKSTAKTSGRRAFMAVLAFAGLRISEACALRRHHLTLAVGRLEVAGTKTDAAAREVEVLPVLRDELAEYLAAGPDGDPYDYLLPTARGTPRNKDNARAHVVDPVFARANELSLERSGRPLPDGLSAHKLRHTYASVRIALGHDLAAIAEDLGHADIQVLWRIYRHTMKRAELERAQLRTLIEGGFRALAGTRTDVDGSVPRSDHPARPSNPASASGF